MASSEDKAYEIMRELDVNYVLVIFGGLTGYASDGRYFNSSRTLLKVKYDIKSAHEAGAYPDFHSMKRLGVFLLPAPEMLVWRRVTPLPSIKSTSTHFYTWVSEVSCSRTL